MGLVVVVHTFNPSTQIWSLRPNLVYRGRSRTAKVEKQKQQTKRKREGEEGEGREGEREGEGEGESALTRNMVEGKM